MLDVVDFDVVAAAVFVRTYQRTKTHPTKVTRRVCDRQNNFATFPPKRKAADYERDYAKPKLICEGLQHSG